MTSYPSVVLPCSLRINDTPYLSTHPPFRAWPEISDPYRHYVIPCISTPPIGVFYFPYPKTDEHNNIEIITLMQTFHGLLRNAIINNDDTAYYNIALSVLKQFDFGAHAAFSHLHEGGHIQSLHMSRRSTDILNRLALNVYATIELAVRGTSNIYSSFREDNAMLADYFGKFAPVEEVRANLQAYDIISKHLDVSDGIENGVYPYFGLFMIV